MGLLLNDFLMKIYIINLASQIRRRLYQRQQLEKLDLTGYQFFRAVTTDDISNTFINLNNDWKRTLTRSELACYISHRTLWEKIACGKNKSALILEDDVLLSNKIKQVLKHLISSTNDLINLETHGKKKRLANKCIKIDNEHNLFRVYKGRVGAAAYILTPKGATKLLEAEKKGIAPADVHITNCYSLNAYQIKPALAIQFNVCDLYNLKPPIDAPSTIKKDKTHFSIKNIKFLLKRMKHQIKYLKYKKHHININLPDFK